MRIWEASRLALAGFGRQLLTTSYPILYDRGEVRFLRADYYFRFIIDNVFFREAVCEDSLLFIRQLKKTKYMKKLIIYLLMTVWMGVSIVLLCNEDESAALLPFALIKAGALVSFIASTKVLCFITDRKLI